MGVSLYSKPLNRGTLRSNLSVFFIALFLGGITLYSTSLWACATCGQSFAFTPKILAISTAFFFLPVSIVCFIAWKVYKSDRSQLNDPDGPKKES